MIPVFDKIGQLVYINQVIDGDGYYCETYADENGDRKIDDFCIHPEDIPFFYNYDYDQREMLLDEYCVEYYQDKILDLNYNFDK